MRVVQEHAMKVVQEHAQAVFAALATAIVALALALGACQDKNQAAPVCGGDTGAPAIDADVMAYLSAARARHHEANVREDDGDVAGAIAALEKLVAMKPPHPETRIVEIEEVLADAYARMAELRLRGKDLDAASRDLEAGLKHAEDPTYFRGHLLEVQGLVEEERAKALDAAGKKDDAKAARAHAIQLFNQVVDIQSKVIERSLQSGDGGTK
jgi:tetratricopeptide (TPR) repeat protein